MTVDISALSTRFEALGLTLHFDGSLYTVWDHHYYVYGTRVWSDLIRWGQQKGYLPPNPDEVVLR